MKHFRRIMCTLVAILCLTLFACGKKENKTPTSDDKTTTTNSTTIGDTKPDTGWSFQIKSNYDGAVVHTDKNLYNSGDTVTLTADSDSEYDCVGFVTCKNMTFDYRDVEYVLSYTNTFTFVFGEEHGFGPAVVNRIFAIYAPKGGKCVLTIYNEDVSVSTAGMFSKNTLAISVYGLSKKENRVLDYYYDFYETWTEGKITPCYDSRFDVPMNQSKMIVFNTVPKDGETVKITLVNSNEEAGTVYQSAEFCQKNGYGIELKATPNPGYEFDGWYEDDYLWSNEPTWYDLMIFEWDITIVAKWNPVSVTTYTLTTTNDNSSYGTCTIYTDQQFEAGASVTLTATPATGYVFDGWYNGTNQVSSSTSYTFAINSNLTLVAKWTAQTTTTYYTLTTTNDNSNYGTCTIYTDQEFEEGTSVTLTATPETGYLFDGWYNGTNQVSTSTNYTFAINSNLTLTAKWTTAPVDKYALTTVNSYENAGSITAYTNKQFDKDSSVTLTATVNTGYAFDGWYNGTTRVCNATTYTFIINSNLTLTAKWFIKVSTTTNYSLAGTYTEYTDELFSPNESIELTESTSISAGYTFEGWYNGTTLLSDEETYNHIVTAPITIEARWTYYTLTIMPCYNSYNDIPDDEAYYKIAGTVSTMNATKITAGQKVYLITTPKNDCVTWLGWYEKNGTEYTLLSTKYSFEYEMPKANKYIVAKFLLYKETSTNVIQFGYYPQSVVEDNDDNADLLAELNSKYTNLPTSTSLNGWKDYGYYDDGAVDSYMWYLDVDLDNDMINDYRAVYFIKYRPNKPSIDATQGNSEAYEAGYRTGNVYWFKYDPVLWDVVGDGGAGDKVLVSRLVLDAQSYYNNTDNREGSSGTTIYPNNYEESTIKAWLKENFMYTTFDLYRRSVLCINYTDNSAASTGNTTNQYALDGEFADYVYLMSYKEAQTYIDGKTYEQAMATDYAKVQGVVMGTGESSDYAITWLRSPSSGNRINAKYISSSGLGNNAGPVTSNYGVRPVVNLIP